MRIGRVYDQLEPGYRRILADRLWPRGLRKNDPRVGQWWPQLAPSTELRQWYAHQPGRFDDFADRYRAELQRGEGAEALAALRDLVQSEQVMVVTASKDVDISHVAVLASLVQ